MCGIAGWFSREVLQAADAAPVLDRMLTAIRHRGPDGQGQQFLPHAVLGHVRLSIIDIEGGAQPLTSSDGSCLLVFNGEIYNYRALRAELRAAGHTFHTESDTEVILMVYRQYGTAGFSRLRGMFAFVLWDHVANLGLLVRDACGIKPLFHAKDGQGRLLFGSEAKALLAAGSLDAQLDEAHLHQLMNFRYLLGEATLFKGVTQVAPGSILQWTPQQGLSELARLQAPVPEPLSILDALRSSVQAHLVADVEVGVHLSGGIDSAAILALASEHASLRTFTLAIGDDPNEAANAADTAQRFGVQNVCGNVHYNLREQLPKLIWHMEMPKVNALQVYLLAGLSREHVKVVLSGMGGDELCYGYNAYRLLWQYQKLQGLLAPLRSSGPFNGFDSSLFSPAYEWNEYDRVRAMVRHGGSSSAVYGFIRNLWDCERHRRWIYGPRMLDSQMPDAFEELTARWPQRDDAVTAAAEFEWRNKLVNDLLWQEDRCSMAHGLESRVPLVDVPLAARLQQFSRQELMPRGKLKARLRQELAAVLPPEVLNRPKSGFQVDSPTFFRQHLAGLAQEQLSPERVRQHGLFNPDFVAFLLQLPARKRYRWHYFMLYLMISSHLWLDIFEGRREAQA